jgi:small subunit ribosomal protein S1
VFVGIEEGVDGMVHKTDLSWTVKVNNPADLYGKGDDVEAIILSINHDEKKVSLGVKQLWDDPWGTLLDTYKPGTVVESAEVLSVAEYGAFVRVADGVDGLIPTGEIPANTNVARGERVKAEISNIDSVDRRITLTMRNPGESQEAEQLMVLKREQTGKGATLGDVLKDKLGAIKTSPASVPPPAPEPAADGDDDDDE